MIEVFTAHAPAVGGSRGKCPAISPGERNVSPNLAFDGRIIA
ncbi:hypothetical protein FRUB_05781 [Fimbriiglobus ruber]|uniref:Uncharacterized protein n=1 Tax=Fimbriiglobus ruber TaxID=1908690 RepID=A0A225DEB8_9BACT|nr:hypothetical protein FRUB_05781 [Fimbriiglobus ruber]